MQPHGNAPEGSDPQDEFRGKNILIERHTIAETAQHFKKTEEEIDKFARAKSSEIIFHSCQTATTASRRQDHRRLERPDDFRIRPRARKCSTNRATWKLQRARRKFLRTNLYEEKSKLLYRNYRGGRSDIEGFADDYAFVIQGLLDLYEASFDVEWLKFAVELQETQDRLFFDEKNGGYFSTSGKDESVFLRMKDDNDGAEPAASSVAALNLLRLAQFRDDKQMAERARKTIDAFAATLSHFPSAMPQMLVALDYSLKQAAPDRDRREEGCARNQSVAKRGEYAFSAEDGSMFSRMALKARNILARKMRRFAPCRRSMENQPLTFAKISPAKRR